MTKKIFLSIVTICGISVIAVMLLITALINGKTADSASEQARREAWLIASAVEKGGSDYLFDTDFDDDIRVTWIDSGGKVKFDSDKDADSLENHADREEISQALQTGEGSSSR